MRDASMIRAGTILAMSVLAVAASAGIWATSAHAQDVQEAAGSQISEAAAALLDAALQDTHEQDVELKMRPGFFPSFQGGTLVMVAFEASVDALTFVAPEPAEDEAAPPPATADLELFAALLQDGQEVARFGGRFGLEEGVGEAGFSPTHSFGTTVAAGTYGLVWGVRDVNGAVAGTRSDELEVPDFASGELQLTTILLARGVEPIREPMTPGAVFDGVRVANLLVNDDLDRVFAADQQLELIYIVAGAETAQPDPQGTLQVSYPGDFSGSYTVTRPDGEVVEESVQGSGSGEWQFVGGGVAAAFQKEGEDAGTLTVQMRQGSRLVTSATTEPDAASVVLPETAVPPGAAVPSIENNYRILDMEGNALVRFPPQRLDRITVGQPIPLGRVPNLEAGGEYQFEVVAKDLVAGTRTERLVPFRLTGGAEAPE